MTIVFFFLQAEDGIRDSSVTGVQTCALPILLHLVCSNPDRGEAEGSRFRVFAYLHGNPCAKRDRADGIRLGNDLQSELFQVGLLVEVTLDGANLVSFDGDEVCSWQGHRPSRWR